MNPQTADGVDFHLGMKLWTFSGIEHQTDPDLHQIEQIEFEGEKYWCIGQKK